MKYVLMIFSVIFMGCAHRGSYGPVVTSEKFEANNGGYIIVLCGYSGYPGIFNDKLKEDTGWIKVITINELGDLSAKTLELDDKEAGFYPKSRYYCRDGMDVIEVSYNTISGISKTIVIK